MCIYIHYTESSAGDIQYRIQNSCGALAVTLTFILSQVSTGDPLTNISQVLIQNQILELHLAIDRTAVL